MHFGWRWLFWALAVALLMQASSARADRLDLIRKRGVLIVGVKSDYPPFGMLDPSGALIGFEPDLAADLAKRLGVALQLVSVNSANRLQKLEEGSIDVTIATLGDTAQRRETAALIEPDYYATGVTIMMPKSHKVTEWGDLRGQRVCATQGAYFNADMAQRYLLDLRVYNGTRDAKLAMRDGHCVGWIYDQVAIATDLRQPEWQDYTEPLPSSLVSPWAIAIAKSEQGGPLGRAISDTVADWLRTGLLTTLEKKWQMKPSEFLADAHVLWTRKEPDGSYTCTRQADGHWPPECRNKAFLTSRDVGGLESAGLLVKEKTGLDLTLIYEPYDRGQFLHGLMTSIGLVIACVIGSTLVALAGALLAESGVPGMATLITALSTFCRMTPPLLQIYIVLFGIGGLLVRYGWTLNAFLVATACLSVYTGAAGVVSLREAAAIIRSRQPRFRMNLAELSVVLRLAYPSLVASLVNVVKATGMASTVAVPELISSSTAIIAERGNPGLMMNVLMITYFLLVMIVVQLFSALERRIKPHVGA